MSAFERRELLNACGKRPLDTLQQALKTMTGCGTFLEFKHRVVSPHRMIDPDLSLVLITEIRWDGTEQTLSFRALMRDETQYKLMATTGQLIYHAATASKTVKHNLMYVSPDERDAEGQLIRPIRRQGLASVVAQSQEDAWETAGYHAVTLTASEAAPETVKFGPQQLAVKRSDFNGRVFWAKQGYDFDPHHSATAQTYIRSAFRRLIEDAKAKGELPEAYADAVLARVQDVPPWVIEDVVAETHDGKERWLGRMALDGQDWDARKELNPNADGARAGLERRLESLRKHPLR
ncbi:hypothetical protein [Deinococcus sonorensis]